MSEYWYDEDHEYEQEPEVELPEDSAELKIKLSINAGQIELGIQRHINEILEQRMKKLVRDKINEHMKSILSLDSWGKDNFKSLLGEIISKKIDERYPDVAENKVNEFYEAMLSLKYTEERHGELNDIRNRAKKKVQGYVETELAESVKLSKDYIEQFAKNYFANNLFRAMGMMDKMLPQTEVGKPE